MSYPETLRHMQPEGELPLSQPPLLNLVSYFLSPRSAPSVFILFPTPKTTPTLGAISESAFWPTVSPPARENPITHQFLSPFSSLQIHPGPQCPRQWQIPSFLLPDPSPILGGGDTISIFKDKLYFCSNLISSQTCLYSLSPLLAFCIL